MTRFLSTPSLLAVSRAARVLIAFVLSSIALLPFASPARAQQPAPQTQLAQASVAISSDSIDLGDSIIYQITLDGVSGAEPPTLPESDAYSASYLGGHDESSRSIMTINGKTTETSYLRYIMQWKVIPKRTGAVSIPAFTFDVGGQTLKASRAKFTVTEAADSPNFKLTLEPDKASAYVGEPVHLRLVWELSGNAKGVAFSGPDGGRQFDIAPLDPRSPAARNRPPQQGEPYRVVSFLSGDAVITRIEVSHDGRSVPAFVMELIVTPRVPGKIEVGPFRVAIDEIVSQGPRSFFDFTDSSRTKRAVVTSNILTLDVKPLPSEGRPADFEGLVGVYSLEAKAGNTEANVGDPVPLTLTIAGPEPMDSMKPPSLESQPAIASSFKPAPEGWDKSDAAGTSFTPGERSFVTTIRPKSPSVTEIPAIRLPYFDTKTGKYSVATTKAIPLKVRASREITAADALRPGSSNLGLSLPSGSPATLTNASTGISANSESLDSLTDQRVSLLAFAGSPPGIAFFAIPPMALVGIIIAIQQRRSRDPVLLAKRAAISQARHNLKHASTSREVLNVVRSALSPFLQIAPEAIAASDPPTSTLPTSTARSASSLLADLEAASFDSASLDINTVRSKAGSLLNELGKG